MRKAGSQEGLILAFFPALTPFHYVQAKSATPLLKLIMIR